MLYVKMIQLLDVEQSVHIGEKKMKAACLQYLYFLNIKEKVLDEKSSKLLSRMNIF